MDKFQKNAIEVFSKIAAGEQTAGWYQEDSKKMRSAWENILRMLSFAEGQKVLDIGCGCKDLADLSIAASVEMKFELTLVDFETVLAALKQKYNSEKNLPVKFNAGIFPSTLQMPLEPGYDRILIYSMIHYTSEPWPFLESAVNLLKPGGRLLLGDLPNTNKKGRFLMSSFGRSFEAARLGVDVSTIPTFSSHQEYADNPGEQNAAVNDSFVERIFSQYRKRGMNVYVHEQPSGLPLSFTREDVVICKP